MRTTLCLAALLGLAALLIFPALDDRALWEDEAETALLAKNVMRFGIPLAWDGRDLISQECGSDYDRNFVWRQTPWLPAYLAAGSFRLFGVDTFFARLPFALLGLLAVPSVWLLGCLVFGDRSTALMGAGSLVLSLPFLLYVRQCRYYSLVIFAGIWVLYFFFATLRGRYHAPAGLATALTVLFHSNYLVLAAMVAGLTAALAVLRPDRRSAVRLGAAALAAAAFNAPWLWVFDITGKGHTVLASLTPGSFARRLGFQLGAIELYAFPALLVILAFVASVAVFRPRWAWPPGTRNAAALVVLSLVVVVVLAATGLPFFRYTVALLPVFALLTAHAVRWIGARSRVLALLVLLLTVGIDRADLLHGALGSPLLKYVGELSHEYDGPIEGLARYLNATAKPGQTVFITYGALALRFATRLEVRGGTSCQPLTGWGPPDWLIVRHVFRLNPTAPGTIEDAIRVRDYVNGLLLSGRYQRFELPYVDTVHDSLPDPDVHLFRPPPDGPRVTLYRRRDS